MPLRQFCLLIPFLVFPGGCNKEHKQDDAPAVGSGNANDDNQAIQGTWRCIHFEEEGMNGPPGKLDDVFYVFEGDKLKVVFQDMVVAEGSYKLDAKAKPKSIDLPEQAGQKEGVGLGIYELDGDDLTICARAFVRKDSPRPREFASAAKSNTILMKFKRDKR
jgi:uncharacterized protein (TIGR03067 family)